MLEFKNCINKKEIVAYVKEIGDELNNKIEDINSLNKNLMLAIEKTASYGQSLTDGLKVIANQVSDLIILDGHLANIVTPFDNVYVDLKNCVIDKDTLTIRLANKKISNSTIKDIKVLINNSNQFFDTSSFLSANSPMELKSIGKILDATIEINLSKDFIISEFLLDIIEDGTKMPKIKEISIISSDGLLAKPLILNSNSTNYNIRSAKDIIRIQPCIGNKIIINITKDDSYLSENSQIYEIKAKSLTINSAESYSNGEVLIGPIKASSPILKAGVFLESDSQIGIEISTNKEEWFKISNINSISKISSIFNINNVDENSTNFDNDIKEIYVKLIISSEKTQPINFNDKYITRTVVSSNGYVEAGYESEYMVSNVFESLNKSYGRNSLFKLKPYEYSKPYAILDNKKLSLIKDKETYIFDETSITIKSDMDKVLIKEKTGKTTELYAGNNIALYTQSIPILSRVNALTSMECCLKMKIPCGTYHLRYEDKEWSIDMSNISCKSIDTFNFLSKEGDKLYIRNSWDDEIETIEAVLVEGQYIISLYDYFFESITDLKFNKYYPYGNLSGTYSISNGKIKTKQQSLAAADAFIQYESQITKKIIKNSASKVINLDRSFAAKYKENLNNFVFKRIAKLQNSNIINGSLKIDTSNAPIPSIINEVNFIDGISEFTKYGTVKKTIEANVNIINVEDIKKDGQMLFTGESDLFVNRVYSENELIFRGDYFVENGTIKLPEGVFTSEFIFTEITYESILSINQNGLYSVDYKKGILYSQNPIYENIEIEYMHSTLHAVYNAVKELEQFEYIDTGNSVIINGNKETYIVETVLKNPENQNIEITPIIKNIQIRYTIWVIFYQQI